MAVLMSDENGNLKEYAGNKLPIGYVGLVTQINNMKAEQDNKIEKIDVIYDRESADPNINWGYTDGIIYNENDWIRIAKNLTKYKKLKIMCGAMSWAPYYWATYEVDLTTLFNADEGYKGGTAAWTWLENARLWTERAMCRVTADKTAIEFKSEYFNSGTETGTRTFVVKIEGVY